MAGCELRWNERGIIVWSAAEPRMKRFLLRSTLFIKITRAADVLAVLKTVSCEYSILAVKEETEQAIYGACGARGGT